MVDVAGGGGMKGDTEEGDGVVESSAYSTPVATVTREWSFNNLDELRTAQAYDSDLRLLMEALSSGSTLPTTHP